MQALQANLNCLDPPGPSKTLQDPSRLKHDPAGASSIVRDLPVKS